MKIISYNVNGIRAAIRKGFLEWLESSQADIVCLQETKATVDQLNLSQFEALGYKTYWMDASSRKGYSGVAILSRIEPRHVAYGCGMEIYDCEGRVIRADFEDFSLMSVYMPSGTTGDIRQGFKMQWLKDFEDYIQNTLEEFPNLIISGDFNICHQPIDIHDPVRNKNSSGFLPEEREWMTQFMKIGFIDTFRYFNQTLQQYSWWSYRAGARKKNLGWRIDYHMASQSLSDRIRNAEIMGHVIHSDHCPVLLEMK